MSVFKDQLAKDMKTFINPDEFAETHKLALPGSVGIGVQIVVDNDELALRSDKNGMSLGDILFFIPAEEWAKVQTTDPAIGQELGYDGRFMFVREWNIDNGLYEIIIGQNRSS